MDSKKALQQVVDEFLQIAAIARPSHHEEKISAYLYQWALAHALRAETDALGNVIVEKSASVGCEAAPVVILQAHMDMVCVAAEGVVFHPLTDPIHVLQSETQLRAQGTSLGADDGIGIAMCLYFLQDTTLRHGPLRVIFTVNEEDGMSSGAMDARYLAADYLINLDWEWLGSLCNSSAGGDFLSFTRAIRWTADETGRIPVQLQISGLLGGHSGVDINRGRANALVCIAGALDALQQAGIGFGLADFHGGQARNAIPASAEAVVLIEKAELESAFTCLKTYQQSLADGFGAVEPHLEFSCRQLQVATRHIMDEASALALVQLMRTLPSNVHSMSPFVGGLVESSQNIGLLALEEHTIVLSAMERSCSRFRSAEIRGISKCLAQSYGFCYREGEHPPAWAVNPKSALTATALAAYRALTGKEMVVEPVHGALECGAFFEKNPALDMIAIGPTLTDVHSPLEACDLESVRITTALVGEILSRLA